jgi:hypothetical protein
MPRSTDAPRCPPAGGAADLRQGGAEAQDDTGAMRPAELAAVQAYLRRLFGTDRIVLGTREQPLAAVATSSARGGTI